MLIMGYFQVPAWPGGSWARRLPDRVRAIGNLPNCQIPGGCLLPPYKDSMAWSNDNVT